MGIDTSMKNHSPYKKSKNLLTKTEADFYVYLKAAVNNDFHINKMTRMCDLVDVDKSLSGKEYMSYFRSISQYHIDFTLCNPCTFKPIICIELDDPSHGRADRRKRDEKVNKIFADINLPLLRIKTERTYSVEDLRNLIEINLKSSTEIFQKKMIDFQEMEIPIDNRIDQVEIAQKNGKTGNALRNILSLIAASLLVIFVIIITSLTFKKLSTHIISGPMQNDVKSNNSKLGYVVPKKEVAPDRKRNTSKLTTKKIKSQKHTLPRDNKYTLADVTITRSGDQPSNTEIKTEGEKVNISPTYYTGNFNIEMVWEGNYRSGNGIIALLDCGTKYLLIEKLTSGIQLEHTVKKVTQGTHTELLPTTSSPSSYYLITSNGTLQEWDNSGKVNEFKRRI